MNVYEYTIAESKSTCGLSQWKFVAKSQCETLVLPDGCQDIIVKEHDGRMQACRLTDLSSSAYVVPSQAGEQIMGIRLHPGTQVMKSALNQWLSANDANELFDSNQLDEFCFRSSNLTEALDCLASSHSSVQSVANELGVSMRSLQRLVKSTTGLSPSFWYSLARARKGARALHRFESLSETAFESGYTDQAHMNREMKRWFTLTPTQIRNDLEVNGLLYEPGYS